MTELWDLFFRRNPSEEEVRELQASWLWYITHSPEKEINEVMLNRPGLVTVNISYSCVCDTEKCADKAENFRMESETDLLRLYHIVLSGNCKTDCIDVPDDPLFRLTPFLDISEKPSCHIISYPDHRRRGNVAFNCSHVFIAMNMKSSYFTSEKIYHKIIKRPGENTLKHKLSNVDLMIEHKRYDILHSGLYAQDWIIGLTVRQEFMQFSLSGQSLSRDLYEKIIVRNDAKFCDIILPAAIMQTKKYLLKAGGGGSLLKCVDSIVKYQANDCLRSFLPYLLKYTNIKKRRKEDWEFVSKCMPDIKIMKNMIIHRIIPHTMALTMAVRKDVVDLVKWIKDTFSLQDEVGNVPHVIQATINNSPEMLKVLLPSPTANSKSRDKLSFTFKFYSALELAISLNFHQCSEILRQYDMPKTKKECPLLELLYDFQSTKYTFAQLVSHITLAGYDLNECFKYGQFRCPPLYDAIVDSDLEMIKILLANGATLFNEKDITVLGCPPRLLAEYIHHNVDICTEKGSVLNDILEGGKKREKLLYFVLYAAHTVPQNDRQRLSELCSDPDFYACSRTMQFLNNPRTLSILCRNSLRKHYGHKIHLFLDSVVLPKYFKEFLNLQEVLKPYMELPLSFSQCYDVLEKDAFVSDFPCTVFATDVYSF